MTKVDTGFEQVANTQGLGCISRRGFSAVRSRFADGFTHFRIFLSVISSASNRVNFLGSTETQRVRIEACVVPQIVQRAAGFTPQWATGKGGFGT